MQERGLSAYVSELIGTFFFVLAITMVGVLFIAVGDTAQFGSDYAVIGLTYAFALTILSLTFGRASGGHFNPAVTIASALSRKIAPIDAVIYILAQLSGGVLGALLTKALLLDEGRAANYGAATVSPLLSGAFAGLVVEILGTFLLVLTFLAVVVGLRRVMPGMGAIAYGISFGLIGMLMVPLTGGAVNPARWFGPALVSGEFAKGWLYIVGPIIGAALAWAAWQFLIRPAMDSGDSAAVSAED